MYMENKEFVKKHDTAIIITVYKNRYTQLIEYISEHTQLPYEHDFILSRQENDPASMEEYYSITSTDNYQVVNCEAKSLPEKRKCYYDWAIKQGYKQILTMDDDLEPYGVKTVDGTHTESGKSNKIKYTDMDVMISTLFKAAQELDNTDKDWAAVSGRHPGYLGAVLLEDQEVKDVEAKGYCLGKNQETYGQLILINLERTKEIPTLNYCTEPIYEDKYFYADCILEGLNVYNINYGIHIKNGMGQNCSDSVVWTGDADNMAMQQNVCQLKQFKKYGGFIRNDNTGRLKTGFNKKSYLGRKNDIPIINKSNKKFVAVMEYLNTVDDKDMNLETVNTVKEILK